MNPNIRLIHILVVVIFAVTACSPAATPPPTAFDVENSVDVLPTPTRKPAATAAVLPETPTNPPAATRANTSTRAPAPTSTEVLALIGTPLPKSSEVIGADNFTRLKKIGQWGRGSIQGVDFAPDGKSFVAISELGWVIYHMDALDQPPQWVAFDKPMIFDEFYFSSDGTMVKFNYSTWNNSTTLLRSFPSAEVQRLENGAAWLKPDSVQKYYDITLKSPDGTKTFKSNLVYGYDETLFSEEKTVREMHDGSRNLLYKLRDDIPYVTYSDRNGPEGCDLSVFSMCGNALMALATTPVKALFASDSRTFAALYAPSGLYTGIMKAYSYVRVYDSANGNLLGSIGGFTKPVQDFDYSPDGKLLVVGFVDGSIILWDIANAKSIHGTRHMNAPAWRVEYSPDSKYLLVQRAEELEVRLTANGALLYRFDMAEFAVSSKRNLVALGDDKGNIQIRDLETGKSTLNIQAHDARIYSIAFSPDGLYLASAGQDCDIKLWDLATGKLLHYFEETTVDAYEMDMPSRIFSTYLEFIPNSNMLVGFGSWGTVVNWNVNSGATNYVIQSRALEYYNGMITLKPHFPEFFGVDRETSRFYINENGFDLATGESLGAYQPPENLPDGCAPVGPISSDQNLLFTLGHGKNHAGQVCILKPQTFELLGTLPVLSGDADGWMDWLYLSPDGRQLIVIVGSGIIYVYQVAQ